jgi:hypothetical protein
MLDRMKKNIISMTLNINDLTASKRSKQNIMADEAKKLMMAK